MSFWQDFPRGYDDMIYSSKRLSPAHILLLGLHKDYNFFILNLGTHPTAYVRVPETHPFYLKHYDDCSPTSPNSLNQIFTFSDSSANFAKYLDQPIPDGWYLGWDYCTINDYSYFNPNGKKWTTEEILKDCDAVIEYLISKNPD